MTKSYPSIIKLVDKNMAQNTAFLYFFTAWRKVNFRSAASLARARLIRATTSSLLSSMLPVKSRMAGTTVTDSLSMLALIEITVKRVGGKCTSPRVKMIWTRKIALVRGVVKDHPLMTEMGQRYIHIRSDCQLCFKKRLGFPMGSSQSGEVAPSGDGGQP